ncbi:M23 family metallopeptidase [Sphingomonas cavernae]|uniref:M23 family metallopeptidase n=1 Tax=Sphingomonas cavernae TaxID=2320861 RepID=A0A418WRJ1_9SPHN|nr:M23 family metallopeptidase [Sphingomonas cavernae]RJF93855.1 M23 family metallopeptidase [Sphingomonas cavernae]
MYQRSDHGFGNGSGTAALSLDQALPAGFGRRIVRPSAWQRIEARLADVELVPDLGARIGSREWFRGLATCAVLISAAWALAPGFDPIIAASPPAMGEEARSEARVLSIAPLALGADTGRRMAATDAVAPLADTPERPSIDLVATLGRGDGFARVLTRAGVADSEAAKVASLVAGAVSLGDIAPGTRMDVTLGRRPNRNVARPLDFLAFRARFDLRLQLERANGALVLKRIPIAVDDTPLRIQGRRGASFVTSARAAGVPAHAIEAYLKAIGGKISINDLGPDDRFDIIIEHARAETGETKTGKLLYAGLDQGRRQVRLIEWTIDGRTEWFDAAGVGKKRGVMTQPVSGRLTSGFGMRRHPLLGYSRLHKGLDFGAPHGAPIYAATDGVVAFAGRNRGYGNYVRLNHAGGIGTGYAHMSRIAVPGGARVRQGQVIGYVGSTGLSTGPHLHYEVYRNGVAINPKSISFVQTSQLAGADLGRFRAKLAQLLNVKLGAKAAPPPAAQPMGGALAKAVR